MLWFDWIWTSDGKVNKQAFESIRTMIHQEKWGEWNGKKEKIAYWNWRSIRRLSWFIGDVWKVKQNKNDDAIFFAYETTLASNLHFSQRANLVCRWTRKSSVLASWNHRSEGVREKNLLTENSNIYKWLGAGFSIRAVKGPMPWWNDKKCSWNER